MRGATQHLWRMRLYFLQDEFPLSRALGGDGVVKFGGLDAAGVLSSANPCTTRV